MMNGNDSRMGGSGTVAALDARRHAFRPDLAATSLKGLVEAPRYTNGVLRQVMRPFVPLRREPRADLGFETEALFGEHVQVLDEANGWSWVQLERDKYVGYIPANALSAEVQPATHRVTALGTFVYKVADIKTPPMMQLSLNSELVIVDSGAQFSRLSGQGGYVFSRHIDEIGKHARDFVDIAERLIGTPYLWGGKSRFGLDCSGLVQVALQAAGIVAPRDSDMQMAELGERVEMMSGLDGLQRGDLVFWKGHVAIMCDSVLMVHANAHHMAVVSETLPEAARRIERNGGTLMAVKRLPRLGA